MTHNDNFVYETDVRVDNAKSNDGVRGHWKIHLIRLDHKLKFAQAQLLKKYLFGTANFDTYIDQVVDLVNDNTSVLRVLNLPII